MFDNFVKKYNLDLFLWTVTISLLIYILVLFPFFGEDFIKMFKAGGFYSELPSYLSAFMIFTSDWKLIYYPIVLPIIGYILFLCHKKIKSVANTSTSENQNFVKSRTTIFIAILIVNVLLYLILSYIVALTFATGPGFSIPTNNNKIQTVLAGIKVQLFILTSPLEFLKIVKDAYSGH